MSGTWRQPQYESQCKTILEHDIDIETRASCRQVNIRNQGTSKASITLSPEAFGIASLNVGENKGGQKA
ncbi:Anthranilate phosphoribosyltransferase [Gossypium arboreum]|uniref:Anthranilate phosphoribosyltransferase n=1 Tax=Gossypium arboreum TaxID=29729 RepID=A0A0B0N1P7_GOSAR|nr:Anthranilate phosphoribosyltransferase [Gossypium arboreum]